MNYSEIVKESLFSFANSRQSFPIHLWVLVIVLDIAFVADIGHNWRFESAVENVVPVHMFEPAMSLHVIGAIL